MLFLGVNLGYVGSIGDITMHISPTRIDIQLERRNEKSRCRRDKDEHPDGNQAIGRDVPWFSIHVAWWH